MGTGENYYLNTEAGMEISGGRETYISILELTQKYAGDKINNMKSAYEEENWKNYEIEVHSLKSSMASIGAARVSELAKMHEKAAKDGNHTYIREHYTELVEELQDTMQEVADYIYEEKQEV